MILRQSVVYSLKIFCQLRYFLGAIGYQDIPQFPGRPLSVSQNHPLPSTVLANFIGQTDSQTRLGIEALRQSLKRAKQKLVLLKFLIHNYKYRHC